MLKEELKGIRSTDRDLRNFGLSVGLVLIVLGAFLGWKDAAGWPYPAGAGALLLGSGLLAPALLKPLQKAWMALALIMGWVMSRVILLLLFYLVLTPLGLVLRRAGKKFLALERDASAESYWNRKEPRPTEPARYEKQF